MRTAVFNQDGSKVYTASVYTAPGDRIIEFETASGNILREYKNVIGIEYLKYASVQNKLIAGMASRTCFIDVNHKTPSDIPYECYPASARMGDFSVSRKLALDFLFNKESVTLWDYSSKPPGKSTLPEILKTEKYFWGKFIENNYNTDLNNNVNDYNLGYILGSKKSLVFIPNNAAKSHLLLSDPPGFRHHAVFTYKDNLYLISQSGQLVKINLKAPFTPVNQSVNFPVSAIAISPDNTKIYLGDFKGFLHVFSMDFLKKIAVKRIANTAIEAIFSSPDNKFLLISALDGAIKLITI